MARITFGPTLPLAQGAEYAHFNMIKDIRTLARQNIEMIIRTIPGEIRTDINFGVGVERFLFENERLENQEFGSLESRIRQQISQYAPYIRIDNFSINIESDNNAATLSMFYTITTQNIQDVIDLRVNFSQ
jgi:phage baseplate assembly protein W